MNVEEVLRIIRDWEILYLEDGDTHEAEVIEKVRKSIEDAIENNISSDEIFDEYE